MHFRPVERQSYTEDRFEGRESFRCDSEAQQALANGKSVTKLPRGAKISKIWGQKSILTATERA